MECPYCGNTPELVDGVDVYPRRPDLWEKKFYLCSPCDAFVGCHPGTTNALGRLANAELRKAKWNAHRVFDPLWKNGSKTRRAAYAWLAHAMGVESSGCHIGMLDVADCNRVIGLCIAEHVNAGSLPKSFPHNHYIETKQGETKC